MAHSWGWLCTLVFILLWHVFGYAVMQFNSLFWNISGALTGWIGVVLLVLLVRTAVTGNLAVHLKLDTLIRGVPDASDEVAGVEERALVEVSEIRKRIIEPVDPDDAAKNPPSAHRAP